LGEFRQPVNHPVRQRYVYWPRMGSKPCQGCPYRFCVLGDLLAKGRSEARVIENERPVESVEFVLHLADFALYLFERKQCAATDVPWGRSYIRTRVSLLDDHCRQLYR
jgi:hypothetical protein